MRNAPTERTPLTLPENDCYRDWLAQLCEAKRLYICVYYGNAGDELIFRGTRTLIDSLALKTISNPASADILLWPGGNPSMWSSHFRILDDLLRTNPNAVLAFGPATFLGEHTEWKKKLLAMKDRIRVIFARDQDSWNCLMDLDFQSNSQIQIHSSFDPAFYCLNDPWFHALANNQPQSRALIALRADHEGRLPNLLEKALMRRPTTRIGRHIARRMNEERRTRIVSEILKSVDAKQVHIEDVAQTNWSYFVSQVARSETVYSDRLHTIILSVLMKRKTIAIDNYYGKISSVLTRFFGSSLPSHLHLWPPY